MTTSTDLGPSWLSSLPVGATVLRRAGASPGVPLQIQVAVGALAQKAHAEHVVPAAAAILAHARWNQPDKGLATFVQLTIDLGLPDLDAAVRVRALPTARRRGAA